MVKSVTGNREIVAVYSEQGFTLDYEATKTEKYYKNDKLMADFAAGPDKALFYFGFERHDPLMTISVSFLHGIAAKFVETLSRNPDIEITRDVAPLDSEECLKIVRNVPFAIGVEFVNTNWIQNIWDRLSRVFREAIAGYDGSVASFLTAYNAGINVVGRVFFHLVESKSEDYPFAFLATYSTGRPEEKKAAHVALKHALLEYAEDQDMLLKLLSTVSRAADKSNFISELVESGELFSPLKFNADEAYTFLKEIALYEECGIMCRIPDWWKKKYNTVRLSVSIGEKQPAQVGVDALLSFDPRLLLGGQSVTKEEIEALLTQTAGLSFLKGKWVEVDHAKLKDVLEAYEKAEHVGGMTFAEAMRMQLGLSTDTALADGDTAEMTNGEWLSSVRRRLLTPEQGRTLKPGDGFEAVLRKYQQTGFTWLASMKQLGFGALLADDMGLGKTVQILALLEYLRENGGVKALLVLPASLVGNWQKEIEKFAPGLRFAVLHGKKTDVEMDEADLFITTYGMAVRLEQLRRQKWDIVILDEAQAIKNPGTKQTKAVKQIPASFRIAVTGTPVENRLLDLWSLFDFLNAGLLGTTKEFGNFAKQMQNQGSFGKLRDIVSPFMLRRLKTDKSIISDLPDKVEVRAYTSLSKKQVVLYNTLLHELKRTLYELEGIERKGVVLASIMKFKQICNHPDQYLGQTSFDAEHSGKFTKLNEICETVREKRERMLIFTQFKEMTEPLAGYLETIFGRKGLVLHGGTQVKKRTELVEKFNGAEYVPFMVLSLKAGGVGLNLTGANHVVHFDRWWNPAIENQATDRAFRIGQQKNVLVHKFVTTGTVEEKIDAMIEEKQKLAGDLIESSGESWITEMSNDELLNLIALD